MVLVVAKGDNPRFGSKRIEVLITFFCQDAHCWDCLGSSFLAESKIFAQCNLPVSVETLDALLFLKETDHPYLAVGVGVGKRLEKGWQAFKVKVDGTDKRGHGIKGRGSR